MHKYAMVISFSDLPLKHFTKLQNEYTLHYFHMKCTKIQCFKDSAILAGASEQFSNLNN